MTPSSISRRPMAAAALLAGALLAGCGPRAGDGPAAAASGASGMQAAGPAASAPPVSVTTVVARKRDLPVVLEANGTVTPVSSVDVRSQVSSVVSRVHVREGQFVRAGDPLFTLDARADEANVARLNAQLAKDQAVLADAQRQLRRSKELLAQNFVSQGAVDTNQTLVDSAQAAIAADRAAIAAARVPLSHARVVAPGAGRVGASNVFVGSAVQANQTPLVTITQLDPVDVAFALPQRHLADVLAALRGEGAAVQAVLPEGGEPVAGKLVFVDSAVDAASGTVKVKARFANRGQRLWPGAFVRATLTVRVLEDAVVVPAAAVVQTARGAIVYLLEGGKATLRPVQLVARQGDEAAVTGLQGGERVVLDGRQNLRPGAAVVERAGGGGARAASGGGASGSAP